jgi:hypothetical protein
VENPEKKGFWNSEQGKLVKGVAAIALGVLLVGALI